MEQRLSLVTLAAEDLAASRAFYETLGWSPGFSNDDVVFYQLDGMVLGLWRRDGMARELDCPPEALGPGGAVLAHNVRSRDEVETVLDEAAAAGATVRPAVEREWGGASGYFADPDGHLWEVAWNPDWPVAADGSVRMA